MKPLFSRYNALPNFKVETIIDIKYFISYGVCW